MSTFSLIDLLPDNQYLGYLDPEETQPRSPQDAIDEFESLAKAGE